MTVLPSIYSNTTETALMAELQKLKSKAQTSERRRQIRREHREASKMQETKKPDPEPHQTEKSKPKRHRPLRVRVKIPIVYMNGKHKGVTVGGLRVLFSRSMQANRRTLILFEDNVSCIPEDMVVLLDLPDGLV
ncbi:hypothetical protein PF004_g20014 [Phytophthora fragariae]|uniref:Uncharacterized protein n=1 Tax=Phytophthora fragariae TaxID=53985 RepID=A0A6G0N935_9STRA|nr:hypothetical protein PF004_g20014 [Phytophthora fragariae]